MFFFSYLELNLKVILHASDCFFAQKGYLFVPLKWIEMVVFVAAKVISLTIMRAYTFVYNWPITFCYSVQCLYLFPVTAKKCYFEQEPDHEGKFRWVMPGTTHKERCSCTVLLPGGVNTMTSERPYRPNYTDQPLFTHDVEVVRNYFGCLDEESTLATAIKTMGNVLDF